MKLRLLILFCAVTFGTACTAPANNTAAPTVAAATGTDVASAADTAGTAEEDPLVCENIIRTGTRVAQRVCMRQSQIDARARSSQETLGDVQRRGNLGGNQSID